MLVTAPERALAHPHVWVTVKSELVYGADGTVTAVRHHWTFDEMFSTFATQGLDTDKDGKLSREELKGLAEVNVTSLKEFDYFTYANGDGKKASFNEAADYWLEHQNGLLTLHFTLPLKTPVKAKTLQVEIYDGTYFVGLQPGQKRGREARQRSRPMQAGDRGAQYGRDTEPGAQRGVLQFARFVEQLGRALRQQDRGDLPIMRLRARAAFGFATLAIAAVGILILVAAPDVLAQQSPFGVSRPPAAPPAAAPTGLTGWIIAKQAEFYRQFSGIIRAAKVDGSAVWTLLGVSFLYGIFHAAGPVTARP